MKAIKITTENAAAIEAALEAVNGRATAHTYTAYSQIEDVAEAAEKALEGLLLKKDRPGARWSKTSGGKVPSSYGNRRIATSISIERKAAGWYLIDVKTVEIHEDGGGKGGLTLTADQDAAACDLLRKQYIVARAAQ